jgi:hypothetical protein
MLIATFWHKRWSLVLAAFLSVGITFVLCNAAVAEKWRARQATVQTEEDIEYSNADGANLVFTLYCFAPFEALLFTAVWGFVGWRYWPRLRGVAQSSA